MKLYGLIGAGGFGREVIPIVNIMLNAISPLPSYQLVFVTEEKPLSPTVNHYPIMSMTDFLAHDAPEKYFNIAISHYAIRKRIADFLLYNKIKPFQIKAVNSIHLDNNDIGEGAIFCPFTTVTSNAKIGKFFHANIYSYVAHDCVIGDYVTFAPQVQCNGNVVIEDNVYVGTGVIIKQGTPKQPIIIGQGAILGMGAVVTKSIPPLETVVGNPAKPFKSKII